MYCFGSTCGWTGDSASDCNSQFDRWKGNHCLRKTGPDFEAVVVMTMTAQKQRAIRFHVILCPIEAVVYHAQEM